KQRMDAYLKELKVKVNQLVSRHSQLNDVELRQEPFEKTATMKIKRFLINNDKQSGTNQKPDTKLS
ncbi:MAG: long-chain fatty acid--CoA ligase, partial [Bacteroidales bacterium]|nr:long-chain fatty acid--CoA ligase [Bacteroidales bacterium]